MQLWPLCGTYSSEYFPKWTTWLLIISLIPENQTLQVSYSFAHLQVFPPSIRTRQYLSLTCFQLLIYQITLFTMVKFLSFSLSFSHSLLMLKSSSPSHFFSLALKFSLSNYCYLIWWSYLCYCSDHAISCSEVLFQEFSRSWFQISCICF